MVQTPVSTSPRRLAEAFLLCRAQDRVLVRGASMGRESRGVRRCLRNLPPSRQGSALTSPASCPTIPDRAFLNRQAVQWLGRDQGHRAEGRGLLAGL